MSPREDVGPILNGIPTHLPDIDPTETQEWLESLDSVIDGPGRMRARYLMLRLLERSRAMQVGVPSLTTTDYVNTISPEQEPWFPGDEDVERRFRAYLRWNAAMIVHRAQRPGVGVGGHISTYASAATLYEVGMNHFFRGKDHPGGGDQIFFQGHASPGMYARAYLEGRLSEDRLDGFRQEKSHLVDGVPLSLPSYPHPRLMPDFWEFPTVSMGIGPMNAIYQAQFNKYLHGRGLKDTSDQHVWAFLGDGEMDEPESRGLLQLAGGEELDNLTFVVNCNLQRLDGPVRGNGKIIQELEAFFRGAGWNVIKVIWGRGWDPLLAADGDGALVHLMNSTSDGDYQTFRANDGKHVRDNFFARDPRTRKMVADWSDEDIWWKLKRGGHDYRKVYAAYKAAMGNTGQPTVILAHTIKGYGLGQSFAGRNATHQMKKFTLEDLKSFRDSLNLPISDEALEKDPYNAPYYHPGADDEVIQYALERRAKLGGGLPKRQVSHAPVHLPDDTAYGQVKKGSGKQQIATTMAFVRLLKDLMRDKEFGKRIVPIIPDEARTFGMDSFFSTIKIYNPHGQRYTPVDAELMLAYREATDGQILHLGINEAGSVAAFTRQWHELRDARRADDPGLRLLLDVRLPAHRRLDLGRRRPDDARVPHRGHRGAHHAHGRGAAARRRALTVAGVDQSRCRALRPGVRLRDRAHHAGRPAPDVRNRRVAHRRRPQRHLLPHRLQRAHGPAGRAGRSWTGRVCCAGSTSMRRAPPRAFPRTHRGCSCSRPAWGWPGRWRPRSCCATTGTSWPTCGR